VTKAISRLVAVIALVLLFACGGEYGVSKAAALPPNVERIINAIDKGDLETLKALLEAGAQPTPAGSPLSPIHAAITHFDNGRLVCDLPALRLLIDHGADPNFIDQDSKFAPLEDALAMGDKACTILLKTAGARVDKPGLTGQSIMQFAVKGAVRTGDMEVLKLVLSWGVDVNVQSPGNRWTALIEASATQQGAQVAEELLRLGANPCLRNSDGLTALDLAKSAYTQAPQLEAVLAAAMRKCQ
jgi:ankyrin repeat protein